MRGLPNRRSTPGARTNGSPTPSAWSPISPRPPGRAPRRRGRGAAGRHGRGQGAAAGRDALPSRLLAARAAGPHQGRSAGQGTQHPLRRHHTDESRQAFMAGTPTAARRRTGSRISKPPASPTGSRVIASWPIRSACCCMAPPTVCWTRCGAGWCGRHRAPDPWRLFACACSRSAGASGKWPPRPFAPGLHHPGEPLWHRLAAGRAAYE